MGVATRTTRFINATSPREPYMAGETPFYAIFYNYDGKTQLKF